jgi:tetratricopeptide (TPR) repeat protein
VSQLERHSGPAREYGDRAGEATSTVVLGTLPGETGRVEEGREHIERARVACREIGWRRGEARALAALGAALADRGRVEEAAARLEEAIALAGEIAYAGIRLVASARLAMLPVAKAAAAVVAAGAGIGTWEATCSTSEAMQARYHLWRATGDPAHLREAKRRLADLLAHAPEECRDSMAEAVPLHRAIAQAPEPPPP